MQANGLNSWALKDLYQAIDLIDRKIAHCNTTQNFALQQHRDAELQKFSSKRATLVKSALTLTSLGVRCDPQFLPRSFAIAVTDSAVAVAEAPATKSKRTPRPRQKRS